MAPLSLLTELKRRNVLRAAAAYVAAAWLLIQVAETTFPAFGLDEGKLRILIVVLGVGFVPAVVLAWLFELTPEGWRRDAEVAHDSAAALRSVRLLDRAIMVFLGLGLTYFAVDKFLLDPARDEARVAQAIEQGRGEAQEAALAKTSIVVLPFTNLSPDPEQTYFADGMAEEMLNLLAQVPQLRVISRTSAFSFKDKNASVAEIAEQLHVSHVLEGSVRRSGDRLRITAQLIEAQTDAHLWSQTYDRTLDDIFAIQDDIAAAVVSQLKIHLLADLPRTKRHDPQAYVLRTQARQMIDALDEDYARIDELLEQAIARDPTYADAWVEKHKLYRLHARYRNRNQETPAFFAAAPPEQWEARAETALARALELDPQNGGAIAMVARRKGAPPRLDLQGAAADFQRALALEPTDPDVLRGAGLFAASIGRFDVAIRLGEFSTRRDPLCSLCVYWLGQSYLYAGRLDQAEPLVRAYVGTGRGGRHTLGVILLLEGQPQLALDEFEQNVDSLEPWKLQGRALALHALGRHGESNAALAELESRWGAKLPHLPAEVYAWSGRSEQAWAWLAKLEVPEYIDPWSPLLQPLAGSQRWEAFWARFGPSLEEIAAIEFDPQLPADG